MNMRAFLMLRSMNKRIGWSLAPNALADIVSTNLSGAKSKCEEHNHYPSPP